MSQPGPDPTPTDPPRAEPRWVKSNVIGGDPTEPEPTDATPERITGPIPVPDQAPVTTEELAGARWFAVAFFIVVIPLGLVLFGLIVWGFIRSIEM
jgi:hypothetical protein